MSPYSTHMPVLATLVQPHQRVVEFGCGEFSTPFFCKNAASVLSIEMQNAEWLHRVWQGIHLDSLDENLRMLTAIGPWKWLEVPFDKFGPFDLALVDGHKKSRWGCINFLMSLNVPVIVAHDTEAPQYDWFRVRTGGYRTEVFDEHTPWTTVWKKI